jgi:hypothetical protein
MSRVGKVSIYGIAVDTAAMADEQDKPWRDAGSSARREAVR